MKPEEGKVAVLVQAAECQHGALLKCHVKTKRKGRGVKMHNGHAVLTSVVFLGRARWVERQRREENNIHKP